MPSAEWTTVELDRCKVSPRESRDVNLIIRFCMPEEIKHEGRRPPLNLAMVIDRSGSMEDKGKIEYARQAACHVVDNLRGSDILGVVEYDDRITTLWRSQPLENPREVKELIEGLEPRGSTNLCGGLMEGVDQAHRYINSERINRVILLSDGLANTGITNHAQIARMVRSAKARGITVSAIGLGLDYDENLMQAIAENGGGNYYYVESPSQMNRIFAQELAMLSKTYAKNVKLRFRGLENVDSVIVYGYRSAVTRGTAEIELEDLYSGEKRSVLLQLRLKGINAGIQKLGSVELSYTDCAANAARVSDMPVSVEATDDEAAVAASVNKSASAEAALITADAAHARYVELYEQGRKAEAKQQIATLQSSVRSAGAAYGDVRLAKKAEALAMESAEMDDADNSPAARQDYLKSSKQRAYYAGKGKQTKYVVQKGDNGYDVEELQQKLKDKGVYSGEVNGQYSPETEKAVQEYQKQNAIQADGVAGPQTLKKLELY
jgi:Ca-activated chloride channel homolog